MNVDRRLTVILPVRGRPEYTRRWFAWARADALPFPVVVADGSDAADSAAVARVVAEGAAEGRPWTHRAFPPGHPRAGLLARVIDAAAAVDTPYAAFAANDDFTLSSGLAACVAALDARPGAAACGGPSATVALPAEEPVWSSRARARATVPRAPIAASSAPGRVEELFGAYDPLWYDVIRAEVMRAAFLRIERAGLRDLNLLELLQSVSVAAAGPVIRVPAPHLLRQEDPAGSASTAIADRGGLLSEILSEGWGTQFDAFVAAAGEAAGCEQARVRAAYTGYARAALARTPGFAGPLPLRRRVAAAVKNALGPRGVEALRRAPSLRQAPAGPGSEDLAPVLAFLSKGAQADR